MWPDIKQQSLTVVWWNSRAAPWAFVSAVTPVVKFYVTWQEKVSQSVITVTKQSTLPLGDR